MDQLELKVIRSIEGINLIPQRSTDGSAGVDLRAAVEEKTVVYPGETRFIPTGISIWVKDPSKAVLILPRSGLSCKNSIKPANSPGLIDSDYQGELVVCVVNQSENRFYIEPGDKIAQAILIPVIPFEFIEVDEFSNTTKRGEGGFGHTGT